MKLRTVEQIDNKLKRLRALMRLLRAERRLAILKCDHRRAVQEGNK